MVVMVTMSVSSLATFVYSFSELPSTGGYLPASLPRSGHSQALDCVVLSLWGAFPFPLIPHNPS